MRVVKTRRTKTSSMHHRNRKSTPLPLLPSAPTIPDEISVHSVAFKFLSKTNLQIAMRTPTKNPNPILVAKKIISPSSKYRKIHFPLSHFNAIFFSFSLIILSIFNFPNYSFTYCDLGTTHTTCHFNVKNKTCLT